MCGCQLGSNMGLVCTVYWTDSGCKRQQCEILGGLNAEPSGQRCWGNMRRTTLRRKEHKRQRDKQRKNTRGERDKQRTSEKVTGCVWTVHPTGTDIDPTFLTLIWKQSEFVGCQKRIPSIQRVDMSIHLVVSSSGKKITHKCNLNFVQAWRLVYIRCLAKCNLVFLPSPLPQIFSEIMCLCTENEQIYPWYLCYFLQKKSKLLGGSRHDKHQQMNQATYK